MEILIYHNDLLYRIDGLDPDSEQVSLVEAQIFYNGEAMVEEVSLVGNLEMVSPDTIQVALGSALGRDCPELREHREHYAAFPRIRVCIGEGAENVPN